MHLAVHLVKWLGHKKGSFVHQAGGWNPGSSLPLRFWVSLTTQFCLYQQPLGSVDPADILWSGKGCVIGVIKNLSSLLSSLLLLLLSALFHGIPGDGMSPSLCSCNQGRSHCVPSSHVCVPCSQPKVLSSPFPWDPHPSHRGATCGDQLAPFPTARPSKPSSQGLQSLSRRVWKGNYLHLASWKIPGTGTPPRVLFYEVKYLESTFAINLKERQILY